MVPQRQHRPKPGQQADLIIGGQGAAGPCAAGRVGRFVAPVLLI
ncbi:MAG: hypothetical protein ACKOPR_08205 [Chakrabartia godavariana]